MIKYLKKKKLNYNINKYNIPHKKNLLSAISRILGQNIPQNIYLSKAGFVFSKHRPTASWPSAQCLFSLETKLALIWQIIHYSIQNSV